jgi:hypothetical protein
MAFFNNTRDEDTHGEHPNLRTYQEGDEEKLELIRHWIRERAGPERESAETLFLKTLEPKHHPHDFDEFVNGELIDTKWLGIRSGGSARLQKIKLDGKASLFINYWTGDSGGSFEIRKDDLNGEVIASARLNKTKGSRKIIAVPLKPVSGRHDLYFVFHNGDIVSDKPVCGVEWIAFRDALPGESDLAYSQMNRTFIELLNAAVENTPVMIENNQEQFRRTHVFERGNWLAQGAKVDPGVPASLNPFPRGEPANRLGFARWLFADDNPLTARSAVNRFWEQIFGQGIVETPEDFGTQGATPSHPELLDWMALRFKNDHKWSIKKLLKDIVMSATYRQDSYLTEELLQKDPSNNFLARAPRLRLSAEQVRDQALAVSGLLSKKMFGKSVMPYQPAGIWNTVYNGESWNESDGEDAYRRSVYTYMKRTSPYPAFMMFDGSSREVCVSRRIRTNTPLQALVTLNDSSFIVAARHFALQMMRKGKTPREQIESGYKQMLARNMAPKKLSIFIDLYEDAYQRYYNDEEAWRKISASEKASPALAAMTIVANGLLNLDEAMMKE